MLHLSGGAAALDFSFFILWIRESPPSILVTRNPNCMQKGEENRPEGKWRSCNVVEGCWLDDQCCRMFQLFLPYSLFVSWILTSAIFVPLSLLVIYTFFSPVLQILFCRKGSNPESSPCFFSCFSSPFFALVFFLFMLFFFLSFLFYCQSSHLTVTLANERNSLFSAFFSPIVYLSIVFFLLSFFLLVFPTLSFCFFFFALFSPFSQVF